MNKYLNPIVRVKIEFSKLQLTSALIDDTESIENLIKSINKPPYPDGRFENGNTADAVKKVFLIRYGIDLDLSDNKVCSEVEYRFPCPYFYCK